VVIFNEFADGWELASLDDVDGTECVILDSEDAVMFDADLTGRRRVEVLHRQNVRLAVLTHTHTVYSVV